ncbi:methyltransferase [Mesorhizobium sp.]|uniref:methyltransferase family protein n=1 Tax=Mesorhizobium sp. TaxID=1871066 RepID=UPI00257AA9AC|nr:methyltransferase [Mesorhizobium sp.]
MTATSAKTHDHPGVIAPPPLVFAGSWAAGVLADSYASGWPLPSALPAKVLAVLLGGAGVVFLAGALGLFRKAGTRPEPWQPTTAIVTSGVYRVTRNPMYVGMALVYAALALALGSLIALTLLPAACPRDPSRRHSSGGAIPGAEVRQRVPRLQGSGAALALDREISLEPLAA